MAPDPDPALTMEQYTRTPEQNTLLGLAEESSNKVD